MAFSFFSQQMVRYAYIKLEISSDHPNSLVNAFRREEEKVLIINTNNFVRSSSEWLTFLTSIFCKQRGIIPASFSLIGSVVLEELENKP